MSKWERYVVVDLETTGLSAKNDKIIEIGAVRVVNGKVQDTYSTFVNPRMVIPQRIVELTGITDEMVQGGKPEDEALEELLEFVGDDLFVGHNVTFDYSFVKQWAVNHKRPLDYLGIDTLKLARKILPADQPKKLECLCEYFKIERNNAHRALDDALETYELCEKLCVLYKEQNVELPEATPLLYHAKKQTVATRKQVERLQQYMKDKGIDQPVNWELLTRSEASRMQDKFYETYGR